MAIHLSFILASFLLLGGHTSGAPLNDREKALLRRAPDSDWVCHYHGPSNSGMDPSLDVPGMVASLCAKVNYKFDGCNNFDPDNDSAKGDVDSDEASGSPVSSLLGGNDKGSCPPAKWNSLLSLCLDSTIGGGSPPPSNFSNPSDDGVNGDNQSSPSSVQSKSIENPKNTSKDPHGKHDGEKSGKPDDDQDKKESAYSFDEPEGAKTDNAPGGKKKDNHPSSNKMKGHKGDKSGKPSNSDASKVDQDKKESASSFDEPEGAKTEKKDSHPSSNQKKGHKGDSSGKPLNSAASKDGHPHSKLSSESFDKPEGDAPDDGSDDNKTGDPSNNGDGSPNGSDHHCRENEKYSSTVEACVDTSFFSKPNDDNTCKKGEYDSGIHLCLNASLLGGSQVSPPADDSQDDSSPGPLNAAEAPGDDGTGTDDNQGDDNQDDQPGSNDQSCPKHQRYTSLLSACVDMKLFTKPMSGDRCGSGLHLDLISGLCLDVSASVNVPGLIKANAHGHVET